MEPSLINISFIGMKKVLFMCVAAFALTACGPKSEKKAEEAGEKGCRSS